MFKPMLLALSFVLLLVAVLALFPTHVTRAAPGSIPITEYPLNPGYTGPHDIIRGPDDNVWFTEVVSGATNYAIARITPTGTITDFPVPGGLARLAAGPDGNLWYTRYDINAVGKMTTAGTVTTYTLFSGNYSLDGITAGTDGNMWVVASAQNQILRIATNGVVTGQFLIPTANSNPTKIVTGTDGNLWFIEYGAKKIGRITLSGSITEFPVSLSDAMLEDITPVLNGNVWFAEARSSYWLPGRYGYVTPAGMMTEFPDNYAQPWWIVADSDGNLWGVDVSKGDNTITRIVNGSVLPIANCHCFIAGITLGGDGKIWFSKNARYPDSGVSVATFNPRDVPIYSVFLPLVAK